MPALDMPRVLGPDFVDPVVCRNKITTGIPHYGTTEVSQSFEDIDMEAIGVWESLVLPGQANYPAIP
jgi:hypothetical protein